MDTKTVTREVRLQQWSAVMRERQQSGLSINAWCETRGIRRHQYFYWQRKLREMSCAELAIRETESEQGMPPSGWTRLEPTQPSPSETGVTIEVGGCRVTATASTDPALLTQVCRMLKAL
jgi:hypothetical protein